MMWKTSFQEGSSKTGATPSGRRTTIGTSLPWPMDATRPYGRKREGDSPGLIVSDALHWTHIERPENVAWACMDFIVDFS